jgi:hypothetical protein
MGVNKEAFEFGVSSYTTYSVILLKKKLNTHFGDYFADICHSVVRKVVISLFLRCNELTNIIIYWILLSNDKQYCFEFRGPGLNLDPETR